MIRLSEFIIACKKDIITPEIFNTIINYPYLLLRGLDYAIEYNNLQPIDFILDNGKLEDYINNSYYEIHVIINNELPVIIPPILLKTISCNNKDTFLKLLNKGAILNKDLLELIHSNNLSENLSKLQEEPSSLYISYD